MITLQRIIGYTLGNIVRNVYQSFSTILLIGAILFICNVILSVHLVAKQGLIEIQQKVDIVLYLKNDNDQIRVSELISELQKISSVREVTITSKEEALRTMMNRFPLVTNPFEKYNLENPLPSHINIHTSDTSQHGEILSLLSNDFFASLFLTTPETNENAKLITKLLSLTELTTKIFITTLILFLTTSTFIIINAISTSIHHKKHELEIIKLVGGSRLFLIGPFMLEGLIYSMTGYVLGTLLLFSFLAHTGLDLISVRMESNILPYIALEGILCLILGLLGSYLIIRKNIYKQK